MGNGNLFNYNGTECELVKRTYQNGRIGLEIVDVKDGEVVSTATINIPDVQLEENQVIVKDYSENEGLLGVLVEKGYLIPTGRVVETGFVSVPICKLLI